MDSLKQNNENDIIFSEILQRSIPNLPSDRSGNPEENSINDDNHFETFGNIRLPSLSAGFRKNRFNSKNVTAKYL